MHAHPQLRADAGTRGNVIADDESAKEFLSRVITILRCRQKCRKHMHAGMTARELAAFIHFQNRTRHPVEEGGCQAVRFHVGAKDAGAARRLRHGGQLLHVGFRHPADNRAEAINQDKLCTLQRPGGKILHLRGGYETRDDGEEKSVFHGVQVWMSKVRQFLLKIACW